MIKSIKGTKDLLPQDVLRYPREIEKHLNIFMSIHGYGEIRTPIFESTELFSRSVGEHTDIVNKEMYTWIDQNGQSLTLRPEMTASVIELTFKNRCGKLNLSLNFIILVHHSERGTKGRLNQFHQFGVKLLDQ